MICPCRDCAEREIGCHTKCEKYIHWQEEHNKKYHRQREIDYMMIEHHLRWQRGRRK